MTPRTPVLTRLYRRMIVKPGSRCWLWIGALHQAGYGLLEMADSGKWARAHRLSWEVHNGPIPEGMHVLHRCDRPACINPTHLFLGTQLDNIADMVGKGRDRLPAGQTHHTAKLSADRVREIRALQGLTQKQIGQRYGVGQDEVSRIRSGRIWKGAE